MTSPNPLLEAFKKAPYLLPGNGKRTVEVLKEALEHIEDQEESDVYGSGKIIEEFQIKMANYLGKESSVFFPSGTMAQQIALRIWCDRKRTKKVAYHPLCHLEIHEEDGLKELHHLEPILLADKDRVIELEDVTELNEDIACLLLELPQREIGGQLPEYKTLEEISAYCRKKGIKLHLDGARLYEILPYYQKSAAEICSLFDSVYISFYKGIGGVAGAILAGGEDFVKESKVWKRRHGGDLISLYPYIISADHYFEKRIGRMQEYFEQAKEAAAAFNDCQGVFTIPEMPVSNMFHVYFQEPKEKVESLMAEIAEETGVAMTGYVKEINETQCSYELSIGDQYGRVPKENLEKAFYLLDEKMKNAKVGS
ncbi:threonine aldolase family protein [Falsibacillus albus]|uniref:Aminotransferase class I/II-fold pyridoxal phosphate-dependent enzyme n=1 Tax=Falsibacillus albus TaxID=2478915 RepID=A0A3L7JZI2_9BACI|nr:aminotransferase class I/II-fold pyridoxal phosphate-dependent enzyme [Falsibacillus albus]RLQ93782.1 aminotransferase class I/II-fold pyridoxal phosphate-dependent enzyme [Falsibacillus albus]